MNASSIPEEVIPALVEALRDPEIQVRANAARVLGRLDSLPGSAIEPLIECAAGPEDGLRLNAALALRLAPPSAASPAFTQLLADSNPRIRLIATSCLLDADPTNSQATAVLLAALADPATRFRNAALELIATLGPRGAVFLDPLHQRAAVELEPAVSDYLTQLIDSLEHPLPEDSTDATNEDRGPATPAVVD
jgi:HEAT repeat protein